MFDDCNRRESLFHTALICLRTFSIGMPRGDYELRRLLPVYRSFEGIFKNFSSLKLEDIKGLEAVIHKLECIEFEFKVLTINDSEFPAGLKNADGASPVVYVRGSTVLFNCKSIAVVGTRELTDSADIEEGKKIVQRLLDRGYVIVSGLAMGCDTLAHQYAVEHGGKTIAVLGTPLDSYAVRGNKPLQDKIAAEHLLVSQYPIGIRTFPSYFARRNKTTVALATDGVVVMRAGDSSGTQHAIRHCLEQGKKLYVLRNNLCQGYNWVKEIEGRFSVPN